MIDAYEVGIQLLLQDDVSAGLAVINRELAEVDRAIAATSAELVGLAQDAGKVMTAVSSGVGHRAAPPTAAEQGLPEATGEQAAQRPTANVSVTDPAATASDNAAAPAIKAADRFVPEVAVTAPLLEGEQTLRRQSVPEQVATSSAPVASGAGESTTLDQPAGQPPAAPVVHRSVAPAPLEPTTAQPMEFYSPTARDVATAAPDDRRASTTPSAQKAFTASVSRAWKPEAAVARAQPVRHTATAVPAAERERPAAPWSGMEQSAPHADTARFPQRAAAPETQEQGRGGSGGGTVMLDGRLVGQWLSEHMAREASRPPAGTSFFDPRQTPAWNVSGAL